MKITVKERTYYFAGNPADNWVQFGGFYWRIIRINEDGSIRMIYQGTDGNKALQYPIGLITADEVAYGGGVYGTANRNFYLYNGQEYWTMSPYIVNSSGNASVFVVGSDGSLSNYNVDNTWGVRPVINLKANVTISVGNGTSSDPYVIA